MKRIEKIIHKSAFDKPGLKFNPRLVLTGIPTAGSWVVRTKGLQVFLVTSLPLMTSVFPAHYLDKLLLQ